MPVIQIENYYLVTDNRSIEKVDKALLFSRVTISQVGLYDTPTFQNLHSYCSYSCYFPEGYLSPSVLKL